ncbi:MAG: VCBS repeat-containing protein [Saprospiraceae bacterium]|nr:VCBS repeat-containing protein [Saprospiraceae bacterium]
MHLFRPDMCVSRVLAWLGFILIGGCYQPGNKLSGPATKSTHTFFQLLDSTHTGVAFSNDVHDQLDFNVLTYRNFYNGGGVAIGDINNDGLSDLYFTANMGSNRLYLNKGDFQFEDITETAGVSGTRAWSTGVAMVDINADGRLDIYVSNSGDISGDNKENELFINNGDLTFTEMAAKYGLNNGGYSTQAVFFDYDLDGDLDCYLLNNSFKDPSKIELYRSMRETPDSLGGDKLYRNDGATFKDVTEEAGIYSSVIGFGLGASIADLNHDHYPDIYVSNDFWERDYLYINQGDGTFSEELIERIDFCSISSMGGDIADINNDGHPEIISTDMLAADNYRLKAMSAFDPYHLEDLKYRANYHYQMAQNCLHLNDGRGNFQEIAMLSGVGATDWSWGALFFDFENDGKKDLFISNGLQKDLMYMDFRDYLDNNDVFRKIAQNQVVDYPSLIAQMPSSPLKNFAFANKGSLQFTNEADILGLGQPSFSNGAAYGDLDNDGDLDLVMNNVNSPAFIYNNQAEKTQHHFLKLKFQGSENNPFGIGATVRLTVGSDIQVQQNFSSRGFQSCIEPYLIFGLGDSERVDQLQVTWPDKKTQTLKDVKADQTITVDYREAKDIAAQNELVSETFFEDVSEDALQGNIRHVENRYNDFDHEVLLLRMLSTEGPRIIKGDVNADDADDIIILGAHGNPDKLLVQQAGKLSHKPVAAFETDRAFESTCGVLIDFDRDGDLDLILASGGNEYQRGRDLFRIRYYQNNGRGDFTARHHLAPQVVGNFSCLISDDIDHDGDQDIFLGGRAIPGSYGLPPRSFLFANNQGKWEDITLSSLAGIGMVTDAVWADTDANGSNDLVVVGDWMDIHIFRNETGTLHSSIIVPGSKGWWTRIKSSDLDGDGDLDFVLGNWGTNVKFKASVDRPLTMYVNDFDRNGKTEFIINWYTPVDAIAYPFATKMDITKQLPALRKQSLKYEDYANQTYETLFDQEVRLQSLNYEAHYLQSALLLNDSAQFSLQALPVEAQISPVFAIAIDDFTGDQSPDIWLGGNFYGLKPQVGRHDASRGLLLENQGDVTFEAVSPYKSGIRVPGEVRDAVVIELDQSYHLLIARNNDEPLLYRKRNAQLQ